MRDSIGSTPEWIASPMRCSVPIRKPKPGRGPTIAPRAGGPRARSAGYERGAQHVDDVLASRGERVLRQRVDVEQAGHERRVREIREHRAVTGEQELTRVVAAQATGIHLALQEVGATI